MKKKVGILYICTGVYKMFWPEFYRSMGEHLLPTCEKHWFIFTDAAPEEIEGYGTDPNIHIKYQEKEPWPYPTLKRFHMFCSILPQLREMDYLYFFNSNMVCLKDITEEEFLPRNEDELVVVQHIGYIGLKPYKYPYDRNPKCQAYIPYNQGKVYVFGGINGASSKTYLAMVQELKRRVDVDLEHGIIAQWHDESHFNRYLYEGHPYRMLTPSYCYPEDWVTEYEPRILGLNKAKRFDVDHFKGYDQKLSKKELWARRLKRVIRNPRLLYWRDTLLRKKLPEVR